MFRHFFFKCTPKKFFFQGDYFQLGHLYNFKSFSAKLNIPANRTYIIFIIIVTMAVQFTVKLIGIIIIILVLSHCIEQIKKKQIRCTTINSRQPRSSMFTFFINQLSADCLTVSINKRNSHYVVKGQTVCVLHSICKSAQFYSLTIIICCVSCLKLPKNIVNSRCVH